MNLAFTVQKFEDNSKITITDTTPDWGVGEIQDVFDTGFASLNITISGTLYDEIDVTASFNGGTQGGLVFTILPEQVGGGSTVPDGDWEIEYYADTGQGQDDDITDTEFIYGNATKAVDDETQVVNLNDFKFENTVHTAMIVGTWVVYMQAIEQAAAEENVTDFRHGLEHLNIMIANKTY